MKSVLKRPAAVRCHEEILNLADLVTPRRDVPDARGDRLDPLTVPLTNNIRHSTKISKNSRMRFVTWEAHCACQQPCNKLSEVVVGSDEYEGSGACLEGERGCWGALLADNSALIECKLEHREP